MQKEYGILIISRKISFCVTLNRLLPSVVLLVTKFNIFLNKNNVDFYLFYLIFQMGFTAKW